MLTINIVANAIIDPNTLSGGDRIFIEFTKRWIKRGVKVNIFTSREGITMCMKQGLNKGLNNFNFVILSSLKLAKFSLPILYLTRVFTGSLRLLKSVSLEDEPIIYSSSDFWPDSIPALILKLRNKRIKWIASFYLFAPKPWQKNSPYRANFRRWIIGLMYWLTQLPVYWLVKKYADMVFVTSEPDVKKFLTKIRGRNKVVVIRGGVDTKEAVKYLRSNEIIPIEKRKYDAVFVGRFHPQKGIIELLDIWKTVSAKRPCAKLAIIGVGPLETEVKTKIKRLNLQGNVELLGFKDGKEKYEIFKQSKIVVHPATYDSGGMAACEAMAWGLPGVSFDLEALKTYYPKGMLKTPCYDLNKFADNIIRLLEDETLYRVLSNEAINWAREWDWDKKAEEVLRIIEDEIRS